MSKILPPSRFRRAPRGKLKRIKKRGRRPGKPRRRFSFQDMGR